MALHQQCIVDDSSMAQQLQADHKQGHLNNGKPNKNFDGKGGI